MGYQTQEFDEQSCEIIDSEDSYEDDDYDDGDYDDSEE